MTLPDFVYKRGTGYGRLSAFAQAIDHATIMERLKQNGGVVKGTHSLGMALCTHEGGTARVSCTVLHDRLMARRKERKHASGR